MLPRRRPERRGLPNLVKCYKYFSTIWPFSFPLPVAGFVRVVYWDLEEESLGIGAGHLSGSLGPPFGGMCGVSRTSPDPSPPPIPLPWPCVQQMLSDKYFFYIHIFNDLCFDVFFSVLLL